MFKKALFSIFVILSFLGPVKSQDTPSPNASNKVNGLELPGDQTVNFDEGFVNIQAKCKGEVKWLVISGTKIKYIPIPQNAIIISVPPQGGLISVFGVGLVDGKLTDFARMNITIGTANNLPPNPLNPPPAGAGPYHFTFLVDLNNTTPDLALVLNSQNVRQSITSKGSFYRLYDIKSPVVAQKKLDIVAQRVGGSAVIVVQRNDGTIVTAYAIPRTEAEVIASITKIVGN